MQDQYESSLIKYNHLPFSQKQFTSSTLVNGQKSTSLNFGHTKGAL